MLCHLLLVFCFKQKTPYEMLISDWSSDVCSSDLAALDDDIRLGEAGFDIAELVFEGAGDVGGLALEPGEIVQDRRAGLDRLFDVDDPGQHLVVDLDQLEGARGDAFRRRRPPRARLAPERGTLPESERRGVRKEG